MRGLLGLMMKTSSIVSLTFLGLFFVWIMARGAFLPCVFIWEGASTDVQWTQEDLIIPVRDLLPDDRPAIYPEGDMDWPHATALESVHFDELPFSFEDEGLHGETASYTAHRVSWGYSFTDRGEIWFWAEFKIPVNETVDWDMAREHFRESFVHAFGNGFESYAMEEADIVVSKLQAVDPVVRGDPEIYQEWEFRELQQQYTSLRGLNAVENRDDRWSFRWQEAEMDFDGADWTWITIDADGNVRAHKWGDHRHFYPTKAEMREAIELSFEQEGLPEPDFSDADWDQRC